MAILAAAMLLIGQVLDAGDVAPADTAPVISAEVEELANDTGVEPVKLQGAVNTTGATPWSYLVGQGLLEPPRPPPAQGPGYGVWDALAACESGGNWAANTGNGFYGGIQFLPGTWRANGGVGLPHQASRAEQIRVGQITQARYGWGQWPACSRRLGLR